MTSIAQLEKSPNDFYYRLSKNESKLVDATVKDLARFMSVRANEFMIAGVGSILRLPRGKGAHDIDLAVVGLKYSRSLDHHFGHVEQFTDDIAVYFDNRQCRLDGVELLYDGSGGPRGSGPFTGIREGVTGKDGQQRVELEPHLEDFGIWGSKGMQIKYPNARPIDIQFVFNRTVDEWLVEQAVGNGRKYEGKDKGLLVYASLFRKTA